MKAELTKIILENVPIEIKNAIGGFEKSFEELQELERLAKIGKATEKFFDDDFYKCEMIKDSEHHGYVVAASLEDLLKWAEGRE